MVVSNAEKNVKSVFLPDELHWEFGLWVAVPGLAVSTGILGRSKEVNWKLKVKFGQNRHFVV